MKPTTRKILFTLAFCLALMSARAQYVTIPDTNFVNWLNANGFASCMVGNQMDTTCNAIMFASTINCSGKGITDLTGITYFKNLSQLICNQDSGIVFPYPPPGGSLSYIPPLPPYISYMECIGGSLTSLPALPDWLNFLDCSCNYLVALLSLPPYLQYGLGCYNNLLTSLPPLPDYLQIFVCGQNLLTSIPTLPSHLTDLYCFSNQLTSLPALPSSLGMLDISDNPDLTCLPGIQNINQFFWYGTGITCFPNALNVSSPNPPITGVPICDFWNSSGCRIFRNINGWIYKDTNSNCLPENNELKLRNVKVNLYEGGILKQQVFSNYQGYYSFDADTGNYTYHIDTLQVQSTVTCPGGGLYSSSITTADSMEFDKNFSLNCLSDHDVGTLSIVRKSGRFRPGSQVNLNILAGEINSQFGLNCVNNLVGSVAVTFTGPATFVSAIPGSLVPTVNVNILNYSAINYGAINMQTSFGIIFQIDTSAQTSQQVCFNVVTTAFGTDYNLANNNYTQCFDITNSFDPNEKEVSPSGSIDTSQHELTYTIHFQNTGNDTALHVYILDTLDNDIDESSIQLLAYSHEPLVQVFGNVIKFNFPNINLPDSTTDETNSHGYVQYRVRIKDNAVVGTQIHNTAYIYFDFNTPVQTNTTFDQIVLITDLTPTLSKGERVVADIYPNPVVSGGELKIVFDTPNDKQANFVMLDLSGRILFSKNIFSSKQTQSITLPHLDEGIYNCVFSYSEGMSHRKLVVHKTEK